LRAESRSHADEKKRAVTNLYNARATRLLDKAVFVAYGWNPDLSDEEILQKLPALNLERAKS